ncbi:MAG: hypothetical protein L0Y58_03850 [Verrucomicrobia subdivision 3 bacterium]|nr:hypothetical protein [Limisphaerales bacterium]
MTHEQLIAKAIEHAKQCGISAEQLHTPRVRDAAVVSFTDPQSSGRAEFYLDAATGDLISGTFSPEFTPKTEGKQFSTAAQDVLALASEESRRFGYDHVGSDHLLLAALSYGKGVGATVLVSAGLTLEAVRSHVAASGSPAEVAPSGYGPSMRGILRAASQHADSLGSTEIEPEHLVLGLLDESDGGAFRTFRHFAVDAARLKRTLLQIISDEQQ